MRARWMAVIVAALMAMCTIPATAQTPAASEVTEAQVTALITAYWDASFALDLDAFDQIVTDDVTLFYGDVTGAIPGRDALKQRIYSEVNGETFEASVTVRDLMIDGSRAIAWVEINNEEPGRDTFFPAFMVMDIENGLIAQIWIVADYAFEW